MRRTFLATAVALIVPLAIMILGGGSQAVAAIAPAANPIVGKGKGALVLPTPATQGSFDGKFVATTPGGGFAVHADLVLAGGQPGIGLLAKIDGDAFAATPTGPAPAPFARVRGKLFAAAGGDGTFEAELWSFPTPSAPPQLLGKIKGKLHHQGPGGNGKFVAKFYLAAP
jgi:hypothetical protein